MSAPGFPRHSAVTSLRALLAIAAPPRGRFLLSVALGAGAAMCTVALMACSGALIDKAALRPPLYTLTVLMAGVQILALGRGPLRYGERLFGHDSALRATGRLRLWLYDEVEPRTPAALGQWRSGDLLSRATADVDCLQDLALRGISPVLVGVSSSVFAVEPGCDHPAGCRPPARVLLGRSTLSHLGGRLGAPAGARGEGGGAQGRALGRRRRAPPGSCGPGGFRA